VQVSGVIVNPASAWAIQGQCGHLNHAEASPFSDSTALHSTPTSSGGDLRHSGSTRPSGGVRGGIGDLQERR